MEGGCAKRNSNCRVRSSERSIESNVELDLTLP